MALREQSEGSFPRRASIEALRQRLQGLLIDPNHPDYNRARAVWNGMIDRRPALIVQCASASDVAAAVDFARDNDLLVAVRGGGHGVAGLATCEGGLVVDLSPLKRVDVDPQARIA